MMTKPQSILLYSKLSSVELIGLALIHITEIFISGIEPQKNHITESIGLALIHTTVKDHVATLPNYT